jgi:hypothetical protein
MSPAREEERLCVGVLFRDEPDDRRSPQTGHPAGDQRQRNVGGDGQVVNEGERHDQVGRFRDSDMCSSCRIGHGPRGRPSNAYGS